MKTITLHGGPRRYNLRTITDLRTTRIRMAIATRYLCGRPAIGAHCGVAIYEPNETRTNAYWSHNEWHGRIIAIID